MRVMAPETTINSGYNGETLVRGRENPSRPVPRPPYFRRKGLRKRLLAIFCVLALAAVLVNLNFVLHWDDEQTKGYIIDSVKGLAGKEANPGTSESVASETLSRFRTHLLVMLAITVVCFGTIILLFVKRIFGPLDSIARAGQEISNGNLSVSAPSNSLDEIGELGEVVNQIAANYQEVLLFTGTTAGNSHSAIEKMARLLNEHEAPDCVDQLQEQVEIVKQDLETLEAMVKDFTFFETYYDGRKVVRHGPEEDG